MKITLNNLMRLGAVGLIAATIGVGCKTTSDRSAEQQKSDKSVAKGVMKALEGDPTYKFTDVQPNVYDGNIQLTGFVETPDQRLRAADITSQVRGVRQVVNNIMLKPMPTGPAYIRDPFGHETNRLYIETNAPPSSSYVPSSSQAVPQQPGQGTGATGEEASNPK